MFRSSNQIHAALDFWHKAGYSSSEAVFGTKPEPVCVAKADEYLEYDDTDTDDDDDEPKKMTDYKRRIKRQKRRQRLLKHVHQDIFEIMRDKERERDGDDDYVRAEADEIKRLQLRQGVENSIMDNVNETMSEIEQIRIYHGR